LIVDDNPFNILAASFLLERSNCRIEKAFNGEECIELLDKKCEEDSWVDLILMDIQMPLLDGAEATMIISKKIKSGKYDNVPVIALTAKQSTEDELEYYKKCGILAVFMKPLNEAKLNEIKSKYFE